MYFDPISPVAVIYWLGGLRTGCWLFGLNWSLEHRRKTLLRRGLEFGAAWEDDQLVRRGLTPEEVVDELLAIEIEMWQSQRNRSAE